MVYLQPNKRKPILHADVMAIINGRPRRGFILRDGGGTRLSLAKKGRNACPMRGCFEIEDAKCNSGMMRICEHRRYKTAL